MGAAFFPIFFLLLGVLPGEILEAGISNVTVTQLPSGCSLLAVSLSGVGKEGINSVFARYDDGTGITKVFFVEEEGAYVGELCPAAAVNATINVETRYRDMMFLSNSTVAVPSSVKIIEEVAEKNVTPLAEEPHIRRIRAERGDIVVIVSYLFLLIALSSGIALHKNVIYLGQCAVRYIRRMLRR